MEEEPSSQEVSTQPRQRLHRGSRWSYDCIREMASALSDPPLPYPSAIPGYPSICRHFPFLYFVCFCLLLIVFFSVSFRKSEEKKKVTKKIGGRWGSLFFCIFFRWRIRRGNFFEKHVS